mgnify:CR=1 FL=1
MPDSYIIDVDIFLENAEKILNEAKKYGIKLYYMTKQIGRNPYLGKKLQEMGYSGVVAVDFREAEVFLNHNLKIGNVGHVFLDIPSGVSNTLNDGALLFNFPEKYRPKTFNLKIIISYSNGMTARTRYDANTGNLYILSKILVPESMYLDTFYFLD